MIKTIHPEKLNRYLWHPGPYIVFYTGNDHEYSHKMDENMKKMSLNYPKLTVFEIRWPDQKSVTPQTYSHLMNYVYLYYECNLKLKYFKPNENEIFALFREAIKYHNINIEKKPIM